MANRLPHALLASAGLLTLGATSAGGQTAQTTEAPQFGTVTTASFLSELEFNDNYNLDPVSLGDATIWTSTFGAGLERRTTADTFLFDAQGSVRAQNLPVIGNEFLADDPRIALNYGRAVDDSALDFGLRFQRADLDFFDPLSDVDPNGQFDDTFGNGTRESLRLDFGADLSMDGPITFGLAGNLSRVNFTDTDPTDDLTNRDVGELRADLGFVVSPLLTLTTGASYSVSNADDVNDPSFTDITTTRADVGAIAQINPVLAATFRIGYSEVETVRETGTTNADGVVGDLALVRTEPTGNTRATISSIVDDNGERYSFTVGKLIVTPRAELDGEIGVSTSESTDPAGIGTIIYTYSLPRTQFRATFSQQATVDDEGDNIISTIAGVSISQALTRVSSIILSADAGLIRYPNDNASDTERANFQALFTQALTQDWNWNAGYRFRMRDEEDVSRSTSNAVFLGVSRDWVSLR